METSKDLDILELPTEGIAAYWLSIKKLMDANRNQKFIKDEIEHTSEHFIKYLLEVGFSRMEDGLVRKLAGIKKRTILKDIRRKIDLMRIILLGIATNENPQKILVRIISKFPISPVNEKQTFDLAKELYDKLKNDALGDHEYLNIDHRIKIENLIVRLLFYAILSRRDGRDACQKLLENIRSMFFAEGLSLIIDGFDHDFIKHRLTLQKKEIMHATNLKMDMAMEMCLGIRNKMTYDEVFTIAKSYML